MNNGHSVVVVTFDENSKAYEALSLLRQADAEQRVAVRGAAVVERQADGTIATSEGGDNMIGLGLAGGSLIGLLVGVLGGPIGVLIGLGTGALAGGAADIYRADSSDEVLDEMSKAVPAGQTALIAEVDEYAVEVIDDEMRKVGGTVARHPAEEVLAALEAGEEAARAAEKEAHRVLREHHKAEFHAKRETLKQEWDARLKSLKQKLSHD